MKSKTYRIKGELAEKANRKTIEFITKEQETVTESEIINMCLEVGLDSITTDDIKKFKSDYIGD